MKKNILSVMFSILVILGCDRQLEIKPKNSLESDAALSNPELLMTGMYSLIGTGGIKDLQEGALYGTDLLLIPDLLAGESYMSWSGTFAQYRQIRNKTMVTTNSAVTRVWRKGYMAINAANTLLENIGSLATPEQDYYKANALFVRAIIHFELLRLFAADVEPTLFASELGIPLLANSTKAFESISYPAKSTINQCYKLIVDDLLAAENLLGTRSDFISVHVIRAFLTRVYLQMKDYPAAFNYANKVIVESGLTLDVTPKDAFNTNTSIERIFQIEQTDLNNAGTANDGLTTFYGCDPNIAGSAGRGDVTVSTGFINRFDSTDLRLIGLIYEGTCNKGSNRSGKWKDPYKNIPIVRLSEMYLTRAECSFRAGDIGQAYNDIKAIRDRAKAFEILQTDLTLKDILNERELELAFEGFRIHDKRRTNSFHTVNNTDDDGNVTSVDTIYYREAKFVLPIPQVEINANKNVVQNSGY